MRQRAMIAIPLALSPELVIMDEPTTALDVVVQREILTEIMNLSKRLNFSVIFITHDLSLLLEIANRIAIMYAGRLVETATASELHKQPRHPYSYGLLNSFPTLRGPCHKMTGIPGSPPDLRAIPPGSAFHLRCPAALETCRTTLPRLQTVTPATPGLQVACHLYNPLFHATPPSDIYLTEKYATITDTTGEETDRSAADGKTMATFNARGEIPSLITPPSGCRFHQRCPSAMPICSQRFPNRTDPGEATGRIVFSTTTKQRNYESFLLPSCWLSSRRTISTTR